MKANRTVAWLLLVVGALNIAYGVYRSVVLDKSTFPLLGIGVGVVVLALVMLRSEGPTA
jgi:hypothetical protein